MTFLPHSVGKSNESKTKGKMGGGGGSLDIVSRSVKDFGQRTSINGVSQAVKVKLFYLPLKIEV